MGIFLSANLYTTFIFFEVMYFTSYVLVIHEETQNFVVLTGEHDSGCSAVLVTLLDFSCLSWGLLEIDQLADAAAALQRGHLAPFLVAGLLTLFGFGVKAGMYPLHTWLPQSYRFAPAASTALLWQF